jgi:hypothetical protein
MSSTFAITPNQNGSRNVYYGGGNRGLSPVAAVADLPMPAYSANFPKLGNLLIAAVFLGGGAQAGVVEDYNAKPIISGHSADSRWQERARMPTDPEVVLGKDWRRSFWAFSPSFAQQLASRGDSRPPQPAHLSVENLSPGLEGIELRVSWDAEQNLYRCSYHLFLSPEVPVLPESEDVSARNTLVKLPPGVGLKQVPPADKSAWLDDVTMVFSTQQMLSGLTMLQAFRRNMLGTMTYASFHQGSCGALAHSSAEKKLEVGIVVDPAQKFSGITRKVRDRTYAVFAVPNSLVRSGSPYLRRASKINDCYFSERRPHEAIFREPAPFREQRERECKQLRTLPIDSTEKPFDIK